MAHITQQNTSPEGVPTPSTGKTAFGIDEGGNPYVKNSSGDVTFLGVTGYTIEANYGVGLDVDTPDPGETQFVQGDIYVTIDTLKKKEFDDETNSWIAVDLVLKNVVIDKLSGRIYNFDGKKLIQLQDTITASYIDVEANKPTGGLTKGEIFVSNDTFKWFVATSATEFSAGQDLVYKSIVVNLATNLIYIYVGTSLFEIKASVGGEVDLLDFKPQASEPEYKVGRIFYDLQSNTWTAFGELEGTSLQLGSELRARLVNDTGGTLLNGAAISVIGAVGTSLQVELLDASDIDSSIRGFGFMTIETIDGNPGYAARYGLVRDLDTLAYEVGDIIYADPEVPGGWTNQRPKAPHYPVRLGVVVVKDAVNGVIGCDTLAFNGSDTSVNTEGTLDGIVLNTPTIAFSVEGGIIYADLTNQDYPTKKLPFIIGGVRYDLNTLTNTGPGGSARIQVPPGASTTEKQTSVLYIYLNGEVPTFAASTTEPNVPYAIVGYVVVYNAVRTASDGRVFGYRRHTNSPNRFDGTHDGSYGLFEEILWAIRSKLGSNWLSGMDATPLVNNTNIKIPMSAGRAAQFRRSSIEAFDGENYLIYNTIANAVTYQDSINLTDITQTAAGDSLLSNNRYYTIRIFYQLNSNGIGNAVIATRPLGYYTTPDEAKRDPSGYAVALNDTDIEEIVFPLYDLVIGRTGTGGVNITLVELKDRRSKLAGGAGGAGATGGGGTDDKVRISAADTTNDYLNPKITVGDEFTKEIANPGANESLLLKFKGWIYNAVRSFKVVLSAAEITADRTLTIQDKDGTIALVEDYPKTNFGASVAPTVNNDTSEGYEVGSYWIDTTANKAYVCLDDTDGAAIWVETTQSGGGGGGSLAIQENGGTQYTEALLEILTNGASVLSNDSGVKNVLELLLLASKDLDVTGQAAGMVLQINQSNNGAELGNTAPDDKIYSGLPELVDNTTTLLNKVLEHGYEIHKITITGDASLTGSISIGTAASGTQIVNAHALSANMDEALTLVESGKYQSRINDTDLYVSGITAGTATLYFTFIKS